MHPRQIYLNFRKKIPGQFGSLCYRGVFSCLVLAKANRCNICASRCINCLCAGQCVCVRVYVYTDMLTLQM